MLIGGIAKDTTVLTGATVALRDGGIATGMLNGALTASGGTVQDMTLGSNAILRASSTVVDGLHLTSHAAAYISAGTAADLEVDQYGILQLCEGMTASNITVHKGGHCYIGKDATVTGTFTIETGATILAFTGGYINFSVDASASADTALLNNMSAIRGKIGYTITVAEGQTTGVYRLADGVKNFTNAVELTYGDAVLEGLTLDQDLQLNGMNFDLTLENGSLYLELTSLAAPAMLSADWSDPGADPMLAAGDDPASALFDEHHNNGLLA